VVAGGQTIAETDDATFQRMFDLNLNSAFYLLRAALPAMRKTGNGRIIAIGSRAALEPGPGVGAYSASKAALVSLIRTLAAENKDVGITANVILPGTIDTPVNRKMIPNADVSKWVQPANVASLVVWLASDAGADVNGAVILAKKPEAELQRSREVSVWAAACSGVRIALLAGVFLHHYREFPSYLLPIQAGRVKVSGGWQKLPADLSARSRLATSYRWQPRCFPTRQTKWRATGYTENFGQR